MKMKVFKILLPISVLFILSCNLYATKLPPYLIEGEMVIDASSQYEAAGFDFYFLNKSSKQIKSFTIVFYMYDEDGNPPGIGKNNIVITVSTQVKGKDSLNGCICLDEYLCEKPDIPYSIDYLYVSKIVYDDGSVWSDPFGLYVF